MGVICYATKVLASCGSGTIVRGTLRNPKTKVKKSVRAFWSAIGKLGGATGKGTEESNDKTRAANATRKAKREVGRYLGDPDH
jgi:hypothetical protein